MDWWMRKQGHEMGAALQLHRLTGLLWTWLRGRLHCTNRGRSHGVLIRELICTACVYFRWSDELVQGGNLYSCTRLFKWQSKEIVAWNILSHFAFSHFEMPVTLGEMVRFGLKLVTLRSPSTIVASRRSCSAFAVHRLHQSPGHFRPSSLPASSLVYLDITVHARILLSVYPENRV